MYVLNELKFNHISQRTIGDVQYPAGWFTDPLEREKIGVIEVSDPVVPDDNLYTSVENADGSYTATPRTEADIAARLVVAKAEFCNQVKAEAGEITQQVLRGLVSEYELAEKEAVAFKGADYTGTIPDSVEDEIASKAAKSITLTATEACDAIIAAATVWRNAQAVLRRNRLTTVSAAEFTSDVAGLDGIKAQWGASLALLKSNLGL
jgi:hypothetical protein